jgi:hypothetical protein
MVRSGGLSGRADNPFHRWELDEEQNLPPFAEGAKDGPHARGLASV